MHHLNFSRNRMANYSVEGHEKRRFWRVCVSLNFVGALENRFLIVSGILLANNPPLANNPLVTQRFFFRPKAEKKLSSICSETFKNHVFRPQRGDFFWRFWTLANNPLVSQHSATRGYLLAIGLIARYLSLAQLSWFMTMKTWCRVTNVMTLWVWYAKRICYR